MEIEFGYGKEIQTVNVPDENLVSVLMSNPVEHERRGADAVRYALENPIGTGKLRDIAAEKISSASGRRPKVVIVTSDVSRPLPSYDVLPSVLDELYAGGFRPEDITVVIALGSYRNNTEEEHRRLVGDRCFNEVAVVTAAARTLSTLAPLRAAHL